MDKSLVLVHGLYVDRNASASGSTREIGMGRQKAFAERGEALGVRNYEWVDGRRKRLANRLLRLVRGTAPAMDAVEIVELDETVFRTGLDDPAAAADWETMAGCAEHGLDAERSFLLLGAPRILLAGAETGQRVLWFGNGLESLGAAEFVAHYTGNHGPLVASHAELIGLHRYRQVPAERESLSILLRERGLGLAAPPAVFAELVAGRPPLDRASRRVRREVQREIANDEKRHIDFGRSMLLLT